MSRKWKDRLIMLGVSVGTLIVTLLVINGCAELINDIFVGVVREIKR